jgi:predicted ABC-type ATPase
VGGLFKAIIIAGPNGAGKTTFAKERLPEEIGLFTYLNADEIARLHSLTDGSAARKMLELLDHHIKQRDDIMCETTLSGNTYKRRIPLWRGLGYTTTLYFLQLPDVDSAIRRVKQRVANGGHDIPEAIIRQRFKRSLQNFEKYKPMVNEWYLVEDRKVILSGQNL